MLYFKNLDYFDLKIFNRWGEVIYHTNDPKRFWDGYYRDELMLNGSYNWVITYGGEGEYSAKQTLNGKVTIVR